MLLIAVERNLNLTETNPCLKVSLLRIQIESQYKIISKIRKLVKAEAEKYKILIENTLLIYLVLFL